MPWTIDLVIDYCSYSRVTKLSINWNCPGKWYQRLSSNWNCLDIWFRKLSYINWICSDNCLRGLSINWNCLKNWYFLTIEIFRTNYFGVSVLIGIVLTIDFRDCPLFGIAWTIDVWCFQLIGIVQTNDFGDCLSVGIVLKFVFTGCLLIGIAWTIDFGWCTVHELKLLGQLLFGDRPLIGTIRTIEFDRGLCYLKTGSYYRRVKLIELVSTPQYHAIIVYQDGEVPCTPNHLQGTAAVLCVITSSIDSMGCLLVYD